MTRESNYIPKSAKASDFKITLSKGALEDGERVSFLEQQIQQAKDTYESSLKNVIEECITLEITALQSQENDTIYTLLPAVAEAINTLEGITSDVHQKVVTLIYLDSSFLAYTSSKSRDSFITSYCSFHNLDTMLIPNRDSPNGYSAVMPAELQSVTFVTLSRPHKTLTTHKLACSCFAAIFGHQ